MTENEIHFRNTDDCIKKIKSIRTMYRDTTPSYVALSDAIQAIEEIQQYRAIGTVEEFKDLKENKFFNFDSPVARVDKKSYNKAIDDLCNEFRKDWEEQCENDMEDCINWYDWLIACAEQLKGEKQ